MALPRYVAVSAIGGLLAIAPAANAADLTTFSNTNVEARYTTSLGTDFGDTVGNGGQGIHDYANTRGNGDPWWRMNDGNPFSNINTYGANDAEDFAGYQFKLPATITEINFSNRIYGDGGTFSATPRVEVLRNAPLKRGGVWETLPVTWSNAYDSTYIDGHRQYKITPNLPTGEVWGVRLIGDTSPGPAWEADGWVGVGELQVSGDLPIAKRYDLQNNLALNQPTIWSHTQWNEPWCRNDGNFTVNSYETTWGGATANDYFGVMFNSPQNRVGAIGITFKTFWDGGWFDPATMKLQYTLDNGATWLDVTGLDTGRYLEDLDYLIATSNWPEVAPYLWTFDELNGVNGIRIYGAPGGVPGGADNFVSALELEVFGVVPEPASLALIALGGLALARRRRR